MTTNVSDQSYDFRVKGQGQQIYLKSVLWCGTRDFFHFLTEGDRIWHKYCLWCVDYKDGLRSSIWPWSQGSGSNMPKLCLTVHNANSSFIFWWCSYLARWRLIMCRWQWRFHITYMTFETMSRSNILSICLTALNANSSSIIWFKVVHILYNDCLWCVSAHKCFGLTIWSWSQGQINIHCKIRMYSF